MTSNSSSSLLYGIHPLATPASSSGSSSQSSSSPSSPPLSSMDDVTTIFVVGFPDDMQEREFQNMFIFSKGFEAASLKWHCRDQQEDQDIYSSMLNNKKQMVYIYIYISKKLERRIFFIYSFFVNYRLALLGFVLVWRQVKLLIS